MKATALFEAQLSLSYRLKHLFLHLFSMFHYCNHFACCDISSFEVTFGSKNTKH